MDSAFFLVREQLLKIIRDEQFENNRIYSEEELVKMLDSSRGTVREVLRSLDREGLISKKHGIGNFVHPRTLNMKMRIDEIQDFIQLIEDGGYKPGMMKDGEAFFYTLPSQAGSEGLENYLEKGMEYYCMPRIYLADQQPAAYCRMFFPKNLFINLPSGEVEFSNVFKFVKAYFNQEIEQTLIWLNARVATEQLADKLKVPPGTALLVWDELLCNYRDQIIGYSRIYFNPEIMNVSMMRKSH